MPNKLISRPATLVCSWAGLLLLSVLSGCVNLAAVRQFAKTSAATADYQVIVNDYAASPARRSKFVPDTDRADTQTQTDERAKQKVRLLAAQQALVEYLSSLGDLAADDLVDTSADFKSLQEAVTGLPFFKNDEPDVVKKTGSAAGQLASLVTDAILEGWRQRQVSKLVKEADPHVSEVVDGLNWIVTNAFDQSLKGEERSIAAYFENAEAEAARAKIQPVIDPIVEKMPAEVAEKARDAAGRVRIEKAVGPIADLLKARELETVETRRARLTNYSKVLQEIKKGHKQLAEHAGDFTNEELVAQLKEQVNKLKAAYSAIEELSN